MEPVAAKVPRMTIARFAAPFALALLLAAPASSQVAERSAPVAVPPRVLQTA